MRELHQIRRLPHWFRPDMAVRGVSAQDGSRWRRCGEYAMPAKSLAIIAKASMHGIDMEGRKNVQAAQRTGIKTTPLNQNSANFAGDH